MKNITALTGRNAKLFFRDKATFFFSILSSLIMVMLYFLFIAKIYIDGINQNIPSMTEKSAGFIIYLQMMIGVLVLNSMSLSLGMFTGAAKDFETQRINSFLITPIKKVELFASYYVGGLIISFLLNLFTWIVTVLLIGIITNYWILASTFFSIMGVLVVSSIISSSIMMLLTAIAKSSTALGVINGCAGTFLGFICGIYMPYSNLGNSVKVIGSFFPFTHLTIWGKNIVLTDAFSQLGVSNEIKDVLMNDWFTANSIGFAGLDAPIWLMLIISGVIGLICLFVGGLIFFKRK